jgi:hypothetical protein
LGGQNQVRAALFPGEKILPNPLNRRQIGTRGPSTLFGKEENYFLYRETKLDSSMVHTP